MNGSVRYGRVEQIQFIMDFNTAYDINTLYPDWQIDGLYMTIGYHHNGAPEKSQWLISVEEEFKSFAVSRKNKWYNEQRGWGIHPSGTLMDVGRLTDGRTVQIVRFQEMTPLGQMIQNIWHGYPADIKGKTNDIPIYDVLTHWLKLGIIKKHQLSKIRRGVL